MSPLSLPPSPLHRRRGSFLSIRPLTARVNSPLLSTLVRCGRPPIQHYGTLSAHSTQAISILYLYGTASLKWPFLHIEIHTSPTDPWTAIIYLHTKYSSYSGPLAFVVAIPITTTTTTTAMVITLPASARTPATSWLALPASVDNPITSQARGDDCVMAERDCHSRPCHVLPSLVLSLVFLSRLLPFSCSSRAICSCIVTPELGVPIWLPGVPLFPPPPLPRPLPSPPSPFPLRSMSIAVGDRRQGFSHSGTGGTLLERYVTGVGRRGRVRVSLA